VPGDRLEIDDGFVARLGANWRFAPYGAEVQVGNLKDMAAMLAYDWRGTYVGAQIGDGGLSTEGIFNPFDIPSETITLTDIGDEGVLGGGQIGSNWQAGSVVFGVEGDIVAVDWDGRQAEFAHPSQAIEFDTNFLATARGRIGWAPNNLLFYATAGLAYLDAELDNRSNNGGKTKDVDTVGGVAGLGMEWGIGSKLSLKLEGDFLFFNEDTNIANIGSEGDPGDFFRIDDGFVARLGLNWRMGPGL
jgi:outer membrane immunogenic protein